MESLQKTIKVKNQYREGYTTKRMVNQPEIVDFITRNPGHSENAIMYLLYGFVRSNNSNNKKYAECLRRALRSGKIIRKEEKGSSPRYSYYPAK